MIEDRRELPADKAALHRKAVRLEWLTVAYLVSAVSLLAVVLGSSQAMKAAWYEDLLSLLPPLAFLVASRVRHRGHTPVYPSAITAPSASVFSSRRQHCSRWVGSFSTTRHRC